MTVRIFQAAEAEAKASKASNVASGGSSSRCDGGSGSSSSGSTPSNSDTTTSTATNADKDQGNLVGMVPAPPQVNPAVGIIPRGCRGKGNGKKMAHV